MHDETVPHYDLAAITAAAARGDIWLSSDDALLSVVRMGITVEEVAGAIASLTPGCFKRCEISTAAGHEGEPYDWYLCPFPAWSNRVLSVKMEYIVDRAVVRVFRLHRSKVPKEMR